MRLTLNNRVRSVPREYILEKILHSNLAYFEAVHKLTQLKCTVEKSGRFQSQYETFGAVYIDCTEVKCFASHSNGVT